MTAPRPVRGSAAPATGRKWPPYLRLERGGRARVPVPPVYLPPSVAPALATLAGELRRKVDEFMAGTRAPVCGSSAAARPVHDDCSQLIQLAAHGDADVAQLAGLAAHWTCCALLDHGGMAAHTRAILATRARDTLDRLRADARCVARLRGDFAPLPPSA